jgi:diacylglycerol kinase family enzyme
LLDPNAPFFIVLNAASGASDAAAARAEIAATLDTGKRAHEFLIAERGSDVEALARQAAERARAAGGVVVAAGGDGTINATARATLATGSPLGIIPQGTFNYTTRAHGIPSDTTEATLALLNARVVRIQVGLVNDHPFLVNAGVGLHPEILEDRENYKAKFGRYRAVALGAGLRTVFREHRQLLLEIEHEGQRELVRTPSLFVGNNALQFAQTGLEQAEDDLEHSRLAAVLVKPISSWALLGLALRGALGQLGDDERLLSFGFRRLVVKQHSRPRTRRLKVATDGEVRVLTPPLVFTIARQRLPLLVPATTTTPP